MAHIVQYKSNGINYTIQQQSSGMRDGDIAAANIQPLPPDKKMNGSMEWMEQTPRPKTTNRRYVVGKAPGTRKKSKRGAKIHFGKETNDVPAVD